jgi:hypothetical protein
MLAVLIPPDDEATAALDVIIERSVRRVSETEAVSG